MKLKVAVGAGDGIGPEVTREALRVLTSVEKAGGYEFAMSLPQGHDTPVGKNASLISGGQAQRLMIARALAREEAKILILDKATSVLDAKNQVAVLHSIRELRDDTDGEEKRRTTLMVTHKPQVMQMCDRILVVDQGEIVEDGTFEQLMEMKGVFAGMAHGGEWIGE